MILHPRSDIGRSCLGVGCVVLARRSFTRLDVGIVPRPIFSTRLHVAFSAGAVRSHDHLTLVAAFDIVTAAATYSLAAAGPPYCINTSTVATDYIAVAAQRILLFAGCRFFILDQRCHRRHCLRRCSNVFSTAMKLQVRRMRRHSPLVMAGCVFVEDSRWHLKSMSNPLMKF